MKEQVFFASAMTTQPDVELATAELVEQINSQMGERCVDLAIVFFTAQFTDQASQIAGALLADLEPGRLLGCTAEGVIGREREIEEGAAITLVAANLAKSVLTPFILQPTDWPLVLLDGEEFCRAVDAPDGTD